MKYLGFTEIEATFMLSIHDEVSWVVKKEHSIIFAYYWQIAHLWTRALFYEKLGFADVPASVAFFSSVEFDFTFRKSVNSNCITPSNPIAIPDGKELTINELIGKIKDKKGN